MLYTHDKCLQVMCIVLRARVMTMIKSRPYVITSMTRDSHVFARVNTYYDNARYKFLLSHVNTTRWNITRHMARNALH